MTVRGIEAIKLYMPTSKSDANAAIETNVREEKGRAIEPVVVAAATNNAMTSVERYRQEWTQLLSQLDENPEVLRLHAFNGQLKVSKFRSIHWALLLRVLNADHRSWHSQRAQQRNRWEKNKERMREKEAPKDSSFQIWQISRRLCEQSTWAGRPRRWRSSLPVDEECLEPIFQWSGTICCHTSGCGAHVSRRGLLSQATHTECHDKHPVLLCQGTSVHVLSPGHARDTGTNYLCDLQRSSVAAALHWAGQVGCRWDAVECLECWLPRGRYLVGFTTGISSWQVLLWIHLLLCSSIFSRLMASVESYYRVSNLVSSPGGFIETETVSKQRVQLRSTFIISWLLQSPSEQTSEVEVISQLNMIRDKILAKQDQHLHHYLLKMEIPLHIFGM